MDDEIYYEQYRDERQLPQMLPLIEKDLSEPYSIYTYRYFLHNWPDLCFLAKAHRQDGQTSLDEDNDSNIIGVIICKLDLHKSEQRKRGYIAMLAVSNEYRKRGIGSALVRMAVDAMRKRQGDEVVLETEITNRGALHLYQNLGFVRDKRLSRYYLNGVDAFRLKLWLRE